MVSYPFTSALVTGASSGIGQEIARQLAETGMPTVVVARRQDRLEELAAEHSNVEVLVADLFTREDLALVEARLVDPDRPIDLVVNNAGFGSSGWFHEIDRDRLEREVQLNVTALTRLTHAALGVMVPRRRGWVLNVSSVASFQPTPKLAVYAATKAYVTSLSEALHEEVRSSGVKVTALCPGLTRTEFQSVSNTSEFQSSFPDVAWLEAADVAREALEATAKGKPLSIPGLMYKGLSAASNMLPRTIMRRASGFISTRR